MVERCASPLLVLSLLVVGCSGASNSASSGFVDEDAAVEETGGTSGAPLTGLPCDVSTALLAKCTSCHGSPLAGGAPFPIAGYDDLVKASPGFPGQTIAQRSVVRMQAGTMPPGGGATAEAATLQAWIDGGMARGTCASTETDAGPSPWDAPTGCLGGPGSLAAGPTMRPGQACVSCHRSRGVNPAEAPTFFGGTVYSSAHETDNCNAVSAAVKGAVVVVTDALGVEHRLPVNSVGNFYSLSSIPTPYTAKVVQGGKERPMLAKQTSGDCNACHTTAGKNGAPGRVLVP